MSSFTTEKKRIMVAQDIQSESIPTRRMDHSDNTSPEYYIRKLSDMSKGVNTKVVAHLAVGLRTMPLR